MSGHDGCGCGHAHAETEMVEPTQIEQAELPMAGGCCSGGSCGSGEMAGGCGSGGCGSHAHGPVFDEVETAVMRGFLSGVFATVLPREKLVEYLETMAQADGSEFQGPAKVLLDALAATAAVEGKPAAISLVETITGETLEL